MNVAGNTEDVLVRAMLVKRGASGSGTSSYNAGGPGALVVNVDNA